MALDVPEADFVWLAQNGADVAAPRCLDAQELEFDVIVKVLPRDDPLRRSYLQRRWQASAVGRRNIEPTSRLPIRSARQ